MAISDLYEPTDDGTESQVKSFLPHNTAFFNTVFEKKLNMSRFVLDQFLSSKLSLHSLLLCCGSCANSNIKQTKWVINSEGHVNHVNGLQTRL